jgi:hypothetical protein
MPVQYERIARAAGNGQIDENILKAISLSFQQEVSNESFELFSRFN